ncbi:hypothetical protein [Gluconobacter cerinus]|uniref:hypothetical protein n=1 Tax=Gluconobacter cerinus TaxID=38307 RepID=UPI001B8CE616|nr:hypothetical protein [Gluconobacter cerinus]MBS1035561.1 hypothetical protein [Gluconobacter cerinus]
MITIKNKDGLFKGFRNPPPTRKTEYKEAYKLLHSFINEYTNLGDLGYKMTDSTGKGFIVYHISNPNNYFRAGSVYSLFESLMFCNTPDYESGVQDFINKIEKKIIILEKQNKKGLKK